MPSKTIVTTKYERRIYVHDTPTKHAELMLRWCALRSEVLLPEIFELIIELLPKTYEQRWIPVPCYAHMFARSEELVRIYEHLERMAVRIQQPFDAYFIVDHICSLFPMNGADTSHDITPANEPPDIPITTPQIEPRAVNYLVSRICPIQVAARHSSECDVLYKIALLVNIDPVDIRVIFDEEWS
jgi:hypothetical protein